MPTPVYYNFYFTDEDDAFLPSLDYETKSLTSWVCIRKFSNDISTIKVLLYFMRFCKIRFQVLTSGFFVCICGIIGMGLYNHVHQLVMDENFLWSSLLLLSIGIGP